MSGFMTNKLDHLFKALSENGVITKDLVTGAHQEYQKLRSAAQTGEKNNSSKKQRKQSKTNDVLCSKCNGVVTSHDDLVAEIRQLQTELDLKSQMCSDLREQLQRRQVEHSIEREQSRIADLNDQNRAEKIGEMYTELYDNQWTEAYRYLDDVMNIREDKILEILQRIIRGSFMFCEDISKAQLSNLGGEITCPLTTWTENKRIELIEHGSDISEKMSKLASKYRRSSSAECLPNLQKSFLENILPTFFDGGEYGDECIVKYAEECITVCWHMVIQEPPMVFVSKIIRKSEFDPKLFRPFTKSGDKYDYLVWPALLLHENGPIVEKGVAQPLDSAFSPLTFRGQRTPLVSMTSPRNVMQRTDSNNPALKGTPWGSQVFASNDPNAPSPSVDLPKTPRSAGRDDEPIVAYPPSPDNKEVLTAGWKP